MYYRDVIGNISTSHLREEEEAVLVEIQPRFPLFGGWKTEYTLGYTLPSNEVLFTDAEGFHFTTRFVVSGRICRLCGWLCPACSSFCLLLIPNPFRLQSHIYDDFAIDEAVIKVVLPEGATNIRVKTPFAVEQSEEVSKRSGRRTLGLRSDRSLPPPTSPALIICLFFP